MRRSTTHQKSELKEPLLEQKLDNQNKVRDDFVTGTPYTDFGVSTNSKNHIKEIWLDDKFKTKLNLFFANIYEVMLVCIGLGVSIYDDDISSLLFQVIMQVLLALSMRKFGENVKIQKKISQGILVVILLISFVKGMIIYEYEPTLNDNFEKNEIHYLSFGFEFTIDEDDNYKFNKMQSLMFETMAFTLSLFLISYYSGREQLQKVEAPNEYIFHSKWLGNYMKIYYLFFFLIACDTCLAINFTQLFILLVLFMIIYLWAFNYSKKNTFIKFAVLWIQRIYILQLFSVALTQVPYLKTMITGSKFLNAFIHVMNICAILGCGQLYEMMYSNYLLLQKSKLEVLKPMKQELSQSIVKGIQIKKGPLALNPLPAKEDSIDPLMSKLSSSQNQQPFKKRQSLAASTPQQRTWKELLESYAAYLYIWVCRICSIVLAYYFHTLPGFIILTWVLLSFISKLVTFVSITVIIFNPIFTLFFLYQYLANIPGLFYDAGTQEITFHPIFDTYYAQKLSLPQIELFFMVFTIYFFILLTKTRAHLRMQRDEVRNTIFEKMANKTSNFLWQYSFYLLKRVQIPVLIFIFLFGLTEVNVYYIGLLFFVMAFVTSIKTYRAYCKYLLVYASFFIWIQYMWSLLRPYFNSDSFIDTTVSNVFGMLTFKTVEENQRGINQYLDYDIPYWQWFLLFLYVLLQNINNWFRLDKRQMKESFINEKKQQEYFSTAEYYEAKCDYELRRKFPKSSKVVNRIVSVFSEMMIVIILVLMGFILAFQPPNFLFWGFLILSLILQRLVVSAGDEHPELYKKCERQSRLLKYYSLMVIILQIAFHFLTDKNFLAQYGFDQYVNIIMGPLSEYLNYIGLGSLTGANVRVKFISQIAFYVMAVILEDYFIDQLQRMGQNTQDIQFDQQIDNQFSMFNAQDIQKLSIDKSSLKDPLIGSQVRELESPLRKKDLAEQEENKREMIEFQFEKARFSIQFLVYKNMNLWGFIDELCLHFYLVTSTITLVFCLYFQISLFFSFYLICTVILCVRASFAQHKIRNNDYIRHQKVLSIDKAHQINKDYQKAASQNLLRVRSFQWNLQYFLLIFAMILMYPTPFLSDFKVKRPEYTQTVNDIIFWLFWSGIYVSPEDLDNYATYAPYYALVIILLLDRYAQRWQRNRFLCTLDKITEFKKLEEKMEKIKKGLPPNKLIKKKDAQILEPLDKDQIDQFVTIGEAKYECQRIETIFREQTDEMKENRLKEKVVIGIKRKYYADYRNSMKICMEQLTLFLLLLSAVFKSNVISIVYMFLLLIFLLMKNKTTGMQMLTVSFGTILILQYLSALFNLNSYSSPYDFPPEYSVYPNYTGPYPYGEYLIPIYLKLDFFTTNMHWSHFFYMDIQKEELNKIWFDFVNLAIMTIYFFWYGNPINSNNIRLSFSNTPSLEAALHDYTRIQVVKKASIKQQKKFEDSNSSFINNSSSLQLLPADDDPKENRSAYDLAADDSHEYFLGSTYYLAKLKKDIFLYHFTKYSGYFFYVAWQLITVIIILLMAILQKLQLKGKTWKMPKYICGPILILCFFDIAIELFLQIPSITFDTQLLAWFGFSKLWIVTENTDPQTQGLIPYNYSLNQAQMKFLILKCMNLFFIYLQSRIYESDSFKSFMKNELKKLMHLASHYKNAAMAYRFNNEKLQQVVTSQQNLRKMYRGVAALKYRIKVWQDIVLGELQSCQQRQHHQKHEDQQYRPEKRLTLQNIEMQADLIDKEGGQFGEYKQYHHHDEEDDEEDNVLQQTHQARQTHKIDMSRLNQELMIEEIQTDRTHQISARVSKNIQNEILKRVKQEKKKDKILRRQKEKLNCCARFYLYLNQVGINQIFFSAEADTSSIHFNNMQQGKSSIPCELEERMILDINLHYNKLDSKEKEKTKYINKLQKQREKEQQEKDEFPIDQMENTKKFISFSNLFPAVIYALMQTYASNQAFFVYVFMIVSQLVSAGLITILYPLSVFGYVLMEECRPGKQYWKLMLYYTFFILAGKFMFQLDYFQQWPTFNQKYSEVNVFLYLTYLFLRIGFCLGCGEWKKLGDSFYMFFLKQ